ncbi:hypothetical cytosolic protein [Syntrophus aciditrophicus SB]|uniref:Hypothetical cytosolic protein n=1 Tax=Syntrophus aciditrophicus (strain SB) TaxID=56780 RepID=Q2LXD5_SYNAS|nr:hypothetical cytosolic protein [Syntrophus aciditrophicus SB]
MGMMTLPTFAKKPRLSTFSVFPYNFSTFSPNGSSSFISGLSFHEFLLRIIGLCGVFL